MTHIVEIADIATVVQTAEAASEAADWETAATAWQEVIRLSPDYPRCFTKAAVALRKLRRFDASDEVMHRAIAVNGAMPDYYVILGDTAMDRRRWRAALAHWKALRTLAPRMPKGYFRAAQAHLALKNPAPAEVICAEGLALLPREKRLLLLHAEAAAWLGHWAEALARLDHAVSLHPRDEKIAARRAEVARSAAAHGLKAAPPREGPLTAFLNRPGPLSEGQSLREAGVVPTVQGIESYLDALQHLGSGVRLQARIDEARAAWQTGLPLERHAGIMRHFEQAAIDARLATVLTGEKARDRGRRPGEPVRVVFFFPHVTQTDHLLPLYERMQHDPRFEPMILCCRSKGTAQADSYEFHATKYPASEGWRVIDGGSDVNQNLSFYELDADLVFFHTPYSLNAGRPFYLRADFAARHCRVAHVTYGYPLLSLDTDSYHVYAGGHVRKCDMVFAESPVCIEPYGRHLGPEKVHVTGYTKVDEFRRHLEPVSFEELAARPGRLDVMWTPHWQLPGDPKGDTETSNFLRYYEVMLRLAVRPDILLHVRPHPLLRLRLNSLGIMRFAEYDAVMDRFRAAGAKVYPAEEGVSYVPALMQAAVLVSDFSSLVAEYTITNRPILFCRTEDVWTNGKWIGDFGKALIENCCYVVDDAAELEARLDEILTTRRHPKSVQMQTFVEANALFPEGSAAERICNFLDRSFNG